MALWARLPLGWKILLAAGGSYGGVMGALALLSGAGAADAAGLGLGSAVTFGVPMAVLLGLFQVLGSSSGGRKAWSGLVERSQVVPVAASPAAVLAAVREELGRIGISRVLEEDAGQIVVRTTVSIWSMGEIVTVTVKPTDEGTMVGMTSRPYLRTTLVDYGVNQQNLDRLGAVLTKPLGSGVEADERAVRRRAVERPKVLDRG